MKKNPGRKERRFLFFSNRRSAGKKRMKINNYYSKILAKKAKKAS